jgi:colanic acid/amylovoran biosynthesis glycosyltransferase
VTRLPAVGQLFDRYLPITQNWIYEQLKFLRCVRTVILARRLSADRSYAFPAMYGVFNDRVAPAYWNRIVHTIAGHYPPLLRAAQREHVLLLHAHFGPVGADALPLARRLRLPLITSFYGFDLCRHRGRPERLRALYRPLFDEGSLFLVEGPAARQQLLELGCPAERTRIHRLGVDLCRFPLAQRERPAGGRVRVLMVGRFTEKKGLIDGLEAFTRALRDQPALHLTIIGDAGRGHAEQQIKRTLFELAQSGDVSNRVTFTGKIDPAEYRAHLAAHDVLLQPSLQARDGDCEGGLPVTIIEAAATGIPTIGTRHCDIPEVVRPGETGWLAEERDVQGLADALRQAGSDHALRCQLGRNARRLVEQRFDARTCTLDSVYGEVLGQPAYAGPGVVTDPDLHDL